MGPAQWESSNLHKLLQQHFFESILVSNQFHQKSASLVKNLQFIQAKLQNYLLFKQAFRQILILVCVIKALLSILKLGLYFLIDELYCQICAVRPNPRMPMQPVASKINIRTMQYLLIITNILLFLGLDIFDKFVKFNKKFIE